MNEHAQQQRQWYADVQEDQQRKEAIAECGFIEEIAGHRIDHNGQPVKPLGGGYGDVLERDPQDVMRDAEEDLVSQNVANNVYKVIYDGLAAEEAVVSLLSREPKAER